MTSRIRRLGILFFAFVLIAAISIIVLSVLPKKAHAEEAATPVTVCDGTHTGWTELSATTSPLASGNYYLKNDVELTSRLMIGESSTAEVTICLHGHVLKCTANDTAIEVGCFGTLTLLDSATPGTNSYGDGTADGSNTIAAGLVSGGKGHGSGTERIGGGVYVNGGTFNMYGGAIAGNTATRGGGVYVGNFSDDKKGTFNMYGGTITGNRADRGGVYVSRNSAFNLHGSVNITGNKLLSAETASNVHLQSGAIINVKNSIEGATIGVTLANSYSGAFTKGYVDHLPPAVVSGGPVALTDPAPIFTYDLSSTLGGEAKLTAENEFAVMFTVELMHRASDSDPYASHKVYNDIIYGTTFKILNADDPNSSASGGSCHTTMWYTKYDSTAAGSGLSGQLSFTKDGSGDYTSPAIRQNYTLYSFLLMEHAAVGIAEKAATCTEEGNYAYARCTGCGNYFTDVNCTTPFTENGGNPIIPALGHKLRSFYEGEATCSSVGLKYTCFGCDNGCGKYFEDFEGEFEITNEVVIPQKSHEYRHHDKVVDCFVDGNLEYINCANGPEYYRVATDEDDPSTLVQITIDGKTYDCVALGDWPTTLPEKLVLKAKGSHTLDHVEALEFDCETDGHKEHYKCNVCNKYFSDEAAANEIVREDGEPASGLPAALVIKAHHVLESVAKIEPTCQEDGLEAHFKCTVCLLLFSDEAAANEVSEESLILPATGVHSLTLVEASEPLCDEVGNTAYYVCEYCNATFSDENGETEITEEEYTIPAIGHKLDGMYVGSEFKAFETLGEESSVYLVCSNPDCTLTGDSGYVVTVSAVEYISDGCLHAPDEYVTVTGTVEEMENQEYTLKAAITVNKLTYDMSNISFVDASVSANKKGHSIEISGTLPEGVTVTYEGNGEKAEGKYTVTAIFSGDYENYNEIPNMTATLTITPSVGLGSVFDTSSHLFYIVITAAVTVVVMLLLFLLISIIMSKARKKKMLQREEEIRAELSGKGARRPDEEGQDGEGRGDYDRDRDYDRGYDDRGRRDDYDRDRGYDRGRDERARRDDYDRGYDDRGRRDDYDRDRGYDRGYDDRGRRDDYDRDRGYDRGRDDYDRGGNGGYDDYNNY